MGWVEAVLSKLPEQSMRQVSRMPSVGLIPAEDEETLLQIGRHLGQGNHFRSFATLGQFLYDSLVVVLRATAPEHLDTTQLTAQLTQRLGNPQQCFRFRVPLATRGDLSLSVTIGGKNDLTIESSTQGGQATKPPSRAASRGEGAS